MGGVPKKLSSSIVIHGRRYQLLDLVRGIKRKNRQAAVNTGPPRGKEAW